MTRLVFSLAVLIGLAAVTACGDSEPVPSSGEESGQNEGGDANDNSNGNADGNSNANDNSDENNGNGNTDDPCETGNGGCDASVSCTAVDGVAECGSCPEGFEDVNGDGTQCEGVPSATDDAVVTDENTGITIDVLANDTFGPDGAGSFGVAVSQPAFGTVEVTRRDGGVHAPRHVRGR
ncbi:MAG: hypothetical protein AAFU77_10080 [Myxococcota bacterium]